MTAVLRLPLLPAAAIAVAVCVVAGPSAAAAAGLGAACALAAAALALASATRTRRLVWWAAAAVAAAVTLRLFAGPLVPPFDLRHAGPLDALRAALARPILTLVPEPEAGVLLAAILGERGTIDPGLAYAFSRTGTTHLLAIDGLKLGFVAAGVAAALRGRARPAAVALAGAAAAIGYGLLVGLGPAVVRSAIMASIGAFAVAAGRRGHAANALCAAATLMLLADPAAVGSAGFLLSVAGTAGIVALHPAFAARLAPLPGPLRHALAATLAVTLTTSPVTAAAFGQVSLVSPLANLVAVPLTPPIMLAGAATMLVGAVAPPLAVPLALVADLLTALLRLIVEASNAIPLAAFDVPRTSGSGAVVAAVTVAAFLAWRRWRPRLPRPRLRPPAVGLHAPSRRAIAIGLAAALILAAAGGAALVARDPGLRVRALDIGQGDAYLVESDGKVALVDGGPDPERLLAELGASLPPWRRRIDLVALTHAHLDHGAGLLAVLDRYDVGLAVAPRGLNAGPLADAWNERIARHGIARADVSAGMSVRLGTARLRVLAPNDDPTVDVPSLVLRFERGPFTMLFSGDATDAAQADLLLDPGPLRARVYVPPHHGAATPYASALVDAVRPEVALISVGLDNRYGHPTAETLAALGRVPTYRTDHDGTIELVLHDGRIEVRPHANGLGPPRAQGIPRVGR